MQGQVNVSPRKLLIAGAGGLGNEYTWVAEEMNHSARQRGKTTAVLEILGYTDDDPAKKEWLIGGYVVHGTIRDAFARFGSKDIGFAVAIGNNKLREQVAQDCEKLGWIPETLVHPSAIVAGGAEIGAGSYLAPGAVICPGARVGRHVIINTHASIGHDSTLEDFAQICPGARVSGACRVGKLGFVGSNATLAPKAVVGDEGVVGANSLVIRKVAPGTTVLGCPALVVGRP
jgi:sugar O-acyltransferase (sialic acid O-acetyltransferase NeuD family)